MRIAIVDDHPMFREGIKHILQFTGKFESVHEFINGYDFLNQIEKHEYDIVLMDIEMPEINGIETTRKALELKPELNILVLSMIGDEVNYNAMVDAGVKGFILKNSSTDELLRAIDTILTGNTYYSQELLRKIIYHNRNIAVQSEKNNNVFEQISHREQEVLQLICEGLTNAEIGDKLFVSQRTIEGHRANLLKKTNTKNTIQLMIYALKNKIVTIEN